MANLRKRGIGQESIKGLAKPQLRWQIKEGILTNGYCNKKMANLGEKGKFRQKWRVCQTFIKGLAKYSNKTTKKDILTNGDFTKMTNLAKKFLRFAKIQMRWQTRHVDNCEFYENEKIWQEFIKGLIKIKTSWRNRHVDNCEFNENEKCCKIREFDKDSSKDWENCLLIISMNSNFG